MWLESCAGYGGRYVEEVAGKLSFQKDEGAVNV